APSGCLAKLMGGRESGARSEAHLLFRIAAMWVARFRLRAAATSISALLEESTIIRSGLPRTESNAAGRTTVGCRRRERSTGEKRARTEKSYFFVNLRRASPDPSQTNPKQANQRRRSFSVDVGIWV